MYLYLLLTYTVGKSNIIWIYISYKLNNEHEIYGDTRILQSLYGRKFFIKIRFKIYICAWEWGVEWKHHESINFKQNSTINKIFLCSLWSVSSWGEKKIYEYKSFNKFRIKLKMPIKIFEVINFSNTSQNLRILLSIREQ